MMIMMIMMVVCFYPRVKGLIMFVLLFNVDHGTLTKTSERPNKQKSGCFVAGLRLRSLGKKVGQHFRFPVLLYTCFFKFVVRPFSPTDKNLSPVKLVHCKNRGHHDPDD
jgi:hypothetical protein